MGVVKMSQKRYVMHLVQKFELADAKPHLIPMQPNLESLRTAGINEVQQQSF